MSDHDPNAIPRALAGLTDAMVRYATSGNPVPSYHTGGAPPTSGHAQRRYVHATDSGPANGASVLLWTDGMAWALRDAVWWLTPNGKPAMYWRLVGPDGRHLISLRSLREVSGRFAGEADLHVVEAVHGGKPTPTQLIAMGESAGRYLAHIEAARGDSVTIHRPRAQAWRKALGMSGTVTGAAADVWVRDCLHQRFGLDVRHLPSHVWDACGMGVATALTVG